MDKSGWFGYDAVQKAIEGVSESAAPQIEIFLNVSQGLAIAFIILNFLKDWVKSTDSFAKRSGEIPQPITLNRIFVTVIFVALLGNTNAVFGLMDGALNEYVNSFTLTNENSSSVSDIFDRWDKEFGEARGADRLRNQSLVPVIGDVVNVLTEILDFFSTFFYFVILVLVKAIAYLIHSIAYPVFLIERGFLLLIMKLVAPLVFVMATLDNYRELFWKWIKVYSAVFITGLFFIVATWFCDSLFFQLSRNFLDNAYSGQHQGDIMGMEVGYLDRHLVQVCFFTMIVFAKVKLYQSGVSLSNRIFA